MLKARWDVVLVGIIKNEADYIEEWIIYYLALGVDHIFIYDNGSDDDINAKVTKFINAGLVTLIVWPMRGGQIDAYNHAATLLRNNCEWVGFADADEFLNLHDHQDIYGFLTDMEADQVVIPWRNFPHSGHAGRPGGYTIENYFWCYRPVKDQVVQTKHFVRVEKIDRVHPHFSSMTSKSLKVADGSAGRFTHAIANPSYRGAQINHYATRSFSENTTRLQKGQVSGSAHKRPETFHPLTPESARLYDFDSSILRHFDRFSAEAERWRYVPQFPHRFGLRQRSEVLRSWNDVLFYFAKSFGNHILGESDVQAHTKFTFLRPEPSGQMTDVGGFLLGYEKTNLLFAVDKRGTAPYFQGSIHFGDFARRYSLRSLTSQRSVTLNDLQANVALFQECGLFAFFDIEVETSGDLILHIDGLEKAFVNIPEGHFAGAIYLPRSEAGQVKIATSGSGIIREILVGVLP